MRAYPTMPELMKMQGLGPQRKIGLFRALQLGDMLCAVPAMRALRLAAPLAHISLIGLPWAASFARRFSQYLDAFIPFPGFPGLTAQAGDIAKLPGFIAHVQQQRFDCMVQMHDQGTVANPLIMSFGAGRNAGFFQPGAYCPDSLHFMPWENGQHEVIRNVKLMQFLGVAEQGYDLEFPLAERDYQGLHKSAPALPAPGTYVCIHAGARLPSRRWSVQGFADVADRLHAAGLQVVLTGAVQETELSRAIQSQMRCSALNLTGKTDLGAFAALVAQARLVICNDTGVSHIAAAVKTPRVVICCGTDPKRTVPVNSRCHRTVHADSAWRAYAAQTGKTGQATEQVTSEQVLNAIFHVLSGNHFTDSAMHDLKVPAGAAG